MAATILAFDLGTTGLKAALVEAASGRILGISTAGYPTRYTEDGGAEQSPTDWWAAVVLAARQLAERLPAEIAQVAAIGCTGMMNGVVLVDRSGNTVRDAIIHADVRSLPQNRRLEREFGRGAIFTATSNRPDCHYSLSKALWLKENEPEVLATAAYLVQAKDYIAGRLTGATGWTDPSDASLTGAFDVRGRRWAVDLWTAAGLDAALLPRIVSSTEIVGALSADAAPQLGLRAGVPVVAGGGDGACATAGSGAGPGEAYHYLGGTSWIGLNAEAPVADDRLSHYCGLDGRVTVFGTVQAAGSSQEWFYDLVGVRHDVLDAEAASVAAGSRNLFFLPYLQGERAPLWDADARGAFFGLSTGHGRPELARSVVEGVAYALRSIVDVFEENGLAMPSLRLLGGPARSPLWQSILAAVYDRPLNVVQDVSSATSLGAAIAAAVGSGAIGSVTEGAARFARIAETVAPDPSLVAAYTPRMEFYRTLYPVLRERFKALGELAAQENMTGS